MSDITYFGTTDFRGENKKFGIRDKDRLRHIYIIGKTGVGKSTLLENMLAQDIMGGNGCAFLDPHGASAEKMLDYVPEHRINDVVYFAPFDTAHPVSFNIMEDVGEDSRHHIANGILSVMKKIWVDAFSGRMEYILQNTLLALMEYPGATLLGINRMLTDKEYRKLVIDNISDPSVKAFWVDEYLKWDDRYRREAGAAIQNKVGQFTSNPLIRNIVGQPKSSFDIREIMDNKKILIANFSKGLLGEQNARLLGSMLSTKIYLSAMSRAELTEEQMDQANPFYLYVDEFQNFANDSFADVLSEARKYKLSLTMAHQYIEQMPETVRDAIFGNVGTMITFRIGPRDAEEFAREFAPVFVEQDFTNLGFAQIYLRLMINGLNSQPFSARTLPPIETPPVSMKLHAFQRSRELYAQPRERVQAEIEAWFAPIPSDKELQHQDYLAQKKAEIEAAGGTWVDFSQNPDLKEEYDRKKEEEARASQPPKRKLPRPTGKVDRKAPPASSAAVPQKNRQPAGENNAKPAPAARLSQKAQKEASRPVIKPQEADELKNLLTSIAKRGDDVSEKKQKPTTKEKPDRAQDKKEQSSQKDVQKSVAEATTKQQKQGAEENEGTGEVSKKKNEQATSQDRRNDNNKKGASSGRDGQNQNNKQSRTAQEAPSPRQSNKKETRPGARKQGHNKKDKPREQQSRREQDEKSNTHDRDEESTRTRDRQKNTKQPQAETAERVSQKGQPRPQDTKKSVSSTLRNNTKPKHDPREAKDTSKDSLRAVLARVKKKAPAPTQEKVQGDTPKKQPASKVEFEQKSQKKYNQTGSAPQRTDSQPAEVPLDVLRDLLED